ncbi:MAG: hypothetical protein IT342_19685 [Candidatus Melainabacteria bacterium]|nr:hypothetical protein [Candidatus Melainabacteria bacterium]
MSSKKVKPTIEERVARSKKNAAKELAKTGLIQIRMEPAVLEQIYALAAEKGVRYTTLVRDWIMERLENRDSKSNPKSADLETTALYLALDEILELKDRVMNLEHGEVREQAAKYVTNLKNVSTHDLQKELLTRAIPQQTKSAELEDRIKKLARYREKNA